MLFRSNTLYLVGARKTLVLLFSKNLGLTALNKDNNKKDVKNLEKLFLVSSLKKNNISNIFEKAKDLQDVKKKLSIIKITSL